jgi:hypothetical protein
MTIRLGKLGHPALLFLAKAKMVGETRRLVHHIQEDNERAGKLPTAPMVGAVNLEHEPPGRRTELIGIDILGAVAHLHDQVPSRKATVSQFFREQSL